MDTKHLLRQLLAAASTASPAGTASTARGIAHVPSQAERELRHALRGSARQHTYSIAQMLGIYPA